MADGKGQRWRFYNDTPKHLVEIKGETVIERTIRLLRKLTSKEVEIIVTSHDPRYEFKGAKRYEPKNNFLEIDRFTDELISNDVCFLYGDTYYTENCLLTIIRSQTKELVFFGNSKSIVGIKVGNGKLFKQHIKIVKNLYLTGEIDTCIGWQVYQSYAGIEIGDNKKIDKNFIFIEDKTFDLNTPEDYIENIRS